MAERNNQTRRTFIAGATAMAGATLTGIFAAKGASAAVPEALRAVDRPVAGILASYGTPRSVVTDGTVSRIEIAVGHIDRLMKSFSRFTALSDRVHVENNRVTFDRGGITYIVTNRVA